MSILGTIRNKYAWLILVLIALAIFAFMLMDSTSGQGGSFTGASKAVGRVFGKKIKAVDYDAKIKELQSLYPNATPEQIQNTAWNEIIEERVFDQRFKDLGVSVTPQEMADLLKGSQPHQYARQIFSSISENGEYDQFQAIEIVDNPSSVDNGELIVNQLQHSIRTDVLNRKYTSLLRNGVNTPTWFAKNEFVKEYKTVDFDFVMLPYSLVEDSDITITDSDLIAFANKNKSKYESKDGYVLQYVPFNVVPTKSDTSAQMVKVQELKERFKETDKAMAFARDFSNAPEVTQKINPRLQYQTSETIQFSEPYKSQIVSSATDEVVGPFIDKGVIYMTRTLDKKTVADSAKVRHILINEGFDTPAGYSKSRALADSLAKVLEGDKSKFGEFVTEYSTDPGSKDNGGVYDFFPQGQMVPAFNDASFNNPIGSIEVVETNYGFHIVEPLDRKGNKQGIELAVIGQTVAPSKETRDRIYTQAQQFEQNSRTEEEFEKNAEEYGGVNTTPNTPFSASSITGIGDNYEIIRWAINAPVASTRYFGGAGGSAYVIRVARKTTDGEIDLEQHRIALTNDVRNEKKAEIIQGWIKEQGGANQDLAGLAQKLDRSVQHATEAKFGASGQTIGYEPELISSLFFLSPGQVDHSIVGRRGVYMVNILNFGGVPPESNFDQYKTRANSAMSQKANMVGIRNQMEAAGEIKDERYKIR